jgi:y4mF family transcriptional regulator
MTENPPKPHNSVKSLLAGITKSTPQDFGLEPKATSGLNKLLNSTYTSMAENVANSSLESYRLKPDMASGLNKLLSPTHTSITESIAKNSLESYRLKPDIAASQNRSKESPPALQIERVSITIPTQLGLIIKSSRIAKNLTQQQLADLSGVGRRFIIECEAGKPRLEFAKVLQVAAAAGIDIFATKR